ncbi:MAG: hypothetical protein RLZ75_3071 [Pseudomonadota bacterium]|jgi:hypothetical protein
MKILKKAHIGQCVTGLLLLTLLTACTEWNSHPVVVDQNFGRAYHNMVKNQTLYPEHGQNDKPTLGMDGQKAQGIINAYRQPASAPLEGAKQAVTMDAAN